MLALDVPLFLAIIWFTHVLLWIFKKLNIEMNPSEYVILSYRNGMGRPDLEKVVIFSKSHQTMGALSLGDMWVSVYGVYTCL